MHSFGLRSPRLVGLLGLLALVALVLPACDDVAPLNHAALANDSGIGSGGSGGEANGGNAGESGLGGGDTPVPPGGICGPGNTRCVEGRKQTCQDDAISYLVENCPDGTVCESGECLEKTCTPAARRCGESGPEVCSADGTAWEAAAACAEGLTCLEGLCLSPQCRPGETACAAKVLLTCAEDGVTWTRSPCEEGTHCIDGECRASVQAGDCPPGEVLCGPGGMRICDESGTAWEEQPCAEGQACYEGRCVDCVRDENCAENEVCTDGACVMAPVHIVTEVLSVGQVGLAYDAPLEAAGGAPPYTWRLEAGGLPDGLEFDPAGRLHGTPADMIDTDLTISVEDSAAGRDSKRLHLRIVGAGATLEITTESPLPETEEGDDYEVRFEAIGGTAPYGFFLVGGALPAGLVLDATGRLAGTPTEVGPFSFRLRAVDAATPPGFAEKDFTLQVTVAPLEVYGDQELNLFVAKLITLPLITVVQNVPIPYETQLLARGGLRPYTWTEQPLPDAIAGFVPNSGIPDGLTLDPDGRLHGAVVDPTQIVDVTIPFTMIHLTGFFFTAEVADTQNPAQTATAIYILPTLPIGG